MNITRGPNETSTGHLAHVLRELGMREINAMACEQAMRGNAAGPGAMPGGRTDI
jgi:hypothetical protein